MRQEKAILPIIQGISPQGDGWSCVCRDYPVLEGEASVGRKKSRHRLKLRPKAGALSFPGRHQPVSERGDQQPRDADREVERAIEVIALGECPDPETSEGQGKDELPDAHPARSHNDGWYF
jgi:hypothetical protein